MQRGLETVGGHLTLTNQRVVFEAHKFNVQRGPDALNRDEIVSVSNAWTRFLGLIPLFPNALAITLRDGRTVKSVVNKRDEWREALSTRAPEQTQGPGPVVDEPGTAASQPTQAVGSVADELAKLSALHDSGALTDEEFEAQKAKLLAG